MATEADVIKRVSLLLGDTPHSETHSNALTDSSPTLTLTTDSTTRGFVNGQYFEWLEDATYEIGQVTTENATAPTIARAQLGSAAAAHAVNARVRLLGRYPGLQIQRQVNDALNADFYPDLFAVYESQITPTPTTSDVYEITATAEEIIAIYQKPDSGNTKKIFLDGYTQPEYSDTGIAPTHRKSFTLPSGQLKDINNTLFVQYIRTPAIADLSEAMQRILELGAAWRLLQAEGAEVQAGDDIQQSGTISPASHLRQANDFWRQQRLLIAKERSILNRRFPRRRQNFFNKHYS